MSPTVRPAHLTRLVALCLFVGLGGSVGCADEPSPGGPDTAIADADTFQAPDLDAARDTGTPDPPRDTDPPDSTDDRNPDVDSGTWTFDVGEDDAADAGVATLSVSSISPTSGPVAGGTKFTIEGRGLTEETALFFGSRPADVRLVDGTLVGQTPAAAGPGAVNIKLRDPATGRAALTDGFEYVPALAFKSALPATLPTRGGFQVTLEGTGFTPGTRVSFAGKTALSHEFVDSETLRVIAPANPAGPADLRLTNRHATLVAEGAVTYATTLEVTDLSPAVGPPGGGTTVTLTGRGFDDGVSVDFGGAAATVNAVAADGRSATVTAPSHAVGLVDVTVTEPGGERHVVPNGFYYRPAGTDFQLAGLRPSQGLAGGGTRVTLVGAGLDASGLTVTIGGKLATVRSQGAGSAVVTTPPHVPETVDVTISDGAGASSTLSDAFEYLPGLTIDRIQPNRGPAAGGTTVAISGSGFQGTTDVRFGGVSAPSFTIQSDTSLQVTTPPHAAGPADVVVERGDASQTREFGFTFNESLDVQGLSPARGSIAGNTYVRIRGRGFVGSNLSVTFDGKPAASVRRLDSQTLAVRTPPHPVGQVDVKVGRDATTVDSPDPFSYYNPSSRNGGTWGGNVEGSVNVAVYASGGAPVDDAFVMLSTSPDTRYMGRTDRNGLVTLSGPEVFGAQTVTATAANFSTTSIQQVDATNITLHLNRLSPPDPRPPADTGTPSSDAGFDATRPDIPMPDTQESDASSDNDFDVIDNPDPDADDPDEPDKPDQPDDPPPPPPKGPPVFTGQLTGLDKIAVPGPNERPKAMIYTTRKSRWSRNPPTGGGNVLYSNGRYRIETRTGDLAVIAVGGLHNTQTGDFEPLMMGLKRYEFAVKGETYRRDIRLEIPLDQTLTFKIPNRPLDSRGPDTYYVRPYLDFGIEGIFGQLPEAIGSRQLVQAAGYPSLTGPISDVTLNAYGGAYTDFGRGNVGPPQTVSSREGIASVSKTIGLPTLIGAPHKTYPDDFSRPTNGFIGFEYTAPERPDLLHIQVYGRSGEIVWEAYIPGSADRLQLPTFPDFSDLPDWRRPEPYPTARFNTMRLTGVRHPNASLNNFNFEQIEFYKLDTYSYNSDSVRF